VVKRVFVDANVLLRVVAGGAPQHVAAANRLLRAASSGRVELVTGPPVLFEVAWTLRRHYRAPREQVLDSIRAVLSQPGLDVLDHALATAAVARAEATGGEFADAYIAVSAEVAGASSVATFNGDDFAKLGAARYAWRA
jgi:predicted nucleic acid-binding protein